MVLTCVLEMVLQTWTWSASTWTHAPHLLREALDFFATGPSIFDPILTSPSRLASDTDELGRRRLVCAQAAYRLLRLSVKLRALWDWSPLFALLRDASESVRFLRAFQVYMVFGGFMICADVGPVWSVGVSSVAAPHPRRTEL